MSKHTPGRLTVPEEYEGMRAICGEPPLGWPYDRYAVAVGIRNGEDARRLVACWNACEGMEDPEAEIAALRKDSEYLMASERLRAQANAQRDELLAALEGVLAWGTEEAFQRSKEWCDKARAAIDKVKGGEI